MTNKELTDMASQAAGMDALEWDDKLGFLCETLDASPRFYWNPLADDGDALRLAVKLGMQVSIGFKKVEAVIVGGIEGPIFQATENNRGNVLAATRRAIVRVAADFSNGKYKSHRTKGQSLESKDNKAPNFEINLRDYLAAKAMQGFAASDGTWRDGTVGMAKNAYQWADAMMAERDQDASQVAIPPNA